MDPIERPVVVAHRGDGRFPENTLPALEAALIAGARYVELDVHLSADRVPVVVHDDTLARTAGRDDEVGDLSAHELLEISVGEPARLGDAFPDVRIPALSDVAALLAAWPGRGGFVEIKRDAVRRHGADTVVRRVLDALGPARARCPIISFDLGVVALARTRGAAQVGWILDAFSDDARAAAEALAPAYIFCSVDRLPAASVPLWPGRWAWAVYDATDVEHALDLGRRGVGFVETRDPGRLLDDGRLAGGDGAVRRRLPDRGGADEVAQLSSLRHIEGVGAVNLAGEFETAPSWGMLRAGTPRRVPPTRPPATIEDKETRSTP